MFKKLFGGGQEKNEPDVADTILGEIRNRLLLLGFHEHVTYGPDTIYEFVRDDLNVIWGGNIIDGYGIYISQGDISQGKLMPLASLSESIKAINDDFKNQVVKALDDWLKTI
jgi:hypothetical protein